MKRYVTVLIAGLLLATGCSGREPADGQNAQTGERSQSPRLDLSVLRASEANYVRFDTPAKFADFTADRRGSVIAGVVEGFARGRRLFSFDDEPMNRVVMRVRVNETVTGDRQYVYDGRAYIELWGGIGWKDPAPRFRAAIPAGTAVVAFAASRFVPSDSRTQGIGDGHPKGTRTLSATHPQSLVFEEDTAPGPRLTSREPLSQFGPAWAKATTLKEFVTRMKQDLRGS